jgi:hypothetical protein
LRWKTAFPLTELQINSHISPVWQQICKLLLQFLKFKNIFKTLSHIEATIKSDRIRTIIIFKEDAMNFDDAVAAHIKWKVRLSQFIDGTSTEKLESATICKDNLCDLGKWIYGDGAKYKAAAHYTDLVTKHANFHKCAGEVLKKVEAGDKPGAKAILSGQFAAASKDTVNAIMQVKKEAS